MSGTSGLPSRPVSQTSPSTHQLNVEALARAHGIPDLGAYVRSRRSEGVSWRRIIGELGEHQIELAHETLRRWYLDEDQEPQKGAA